MKTKLNPTIKTRYLKFCWTCCLCAFALTVATGAARANTEHVAPIKATASVSKTTAGVAEPVEINVEVLAPAGVTVRFPEVGESLGAFEVIKSQDRMDVPTNEGRKSTRRLTIESLTTGELTIPELEVYYADRRGEKSEFNTASTNSIPITIQSLLTEADDPNDFRDIKNVVFLPERQTQVTSSWTAWIAVLSIGLFGFVGLILAKRLWLRPSPKQKALRELDRLFNSELLTPSNSKAIYAGTTGVLREFIRSQFEIPATRQTTNEFLRAVANDHRLADPLPERLEYFLESADRVKFAGLSCPTEVLCKAINSAREFVIKCDELSQLNAVEQRDCTNNHNN